jgi:hypothetical protein
MPHWLIFSNNCEEAIMAGLIKTQNYPQKYGLDLWGMKAQKTNFVYSQAHLPGAWR